jgi:hypothetical protein
MNLNPAQVLDPVFHFLDGIIEEFGVYLFLVLVWLSLFVIAWIFSGGLRRKQSQQNSTGIIPGIIVMMRPHVEPQPPLPPIGIEVDPAWNDNDDCY